MDINFQQPLYLLLLVPAILAIIWWLKTQRRVKGPKKYVISAIRLIIFASLILSLAKPELLFPVKGETVVFVVDRSASMKNDPRIEQFLTEAIELKKPEDRYGIISIAAEAQVEQPLTTNTELTALGAQVNANATDLANGIRLASSMIPNNTNGKIVLISDGIETQGDAAKEIELVKERGIVVDSYSLQQEMGAEVLVSSLKVPSITYLNEQYQSTVVIESTVATTGALKIYEDNFEIGSYDLNIEKGRNSYVFQQSVQHEGFHKLRVELVADKDTVNLNNQAYAFMQAQAEPNVLILEGHSGAAANLINALEAGSVNTETVDLNMLPKELEDYKKYSTIVMADVQATQISDADMNRIQTAVKDLGIGLIMTGGNDSFGLGGWFKTPIEEALPVYMDLKNKEKLPSLGLMLVIDKSGSMASGMEGYNKMELAKEAAIRATEMLNEKDYVGVVAFDGNPWVVVEPDSASNLDEIQEKISGIHADGGTDIYPALLEGYKQLEELNTQRKHIILLTDGQSGRTDDYQGLLKEITDNNITVSTVAIGDDADTYLLEQIAEMGKGRYYFSNDPSSIPKIFSKETALATRTFIVEKPQVPVKNIVEDFNALQGELPGLNAYIATTPKQTAEVNLQSFDQDPILSRWQYGLGRTVAWTSDIEGKWSADWVNWQQYSELWNQIVKWTFPNVNQGEWNTITEIDGSTAIITVQISTNEIAQQMEAIIINEKMETETIKLKPTGLGTLQGNFKITDTGTYLIQIVQREGDKVIASKTEGLNVPYSQEYAISKDGEYRLNEITKLGNGKLITDPTEVFTDVTHGYESQNINHLLLMLAALLWPIDVGLRRVNISPRSLDKLRFKKGKSSTASEKASSIANLVDRKKSRPDKVTDSRHINEELLINKTEKPVNSNKLNREKIAPKANPNNQTNQNETLQRLLNAKNKNNK